MWNKIVEEQMEGNPYVGFQGVLQKGPRGVSCQSFKNCVMFHLFTVLPINVTKQEKYHITNVHKKPQHVKVDQFVWPVEQLKSTSHRCCASTTAPASTPPPSKRTFHSQRLS
jgi:hypothetical protein